MISPIRDSSVKLVKCSKALSKSGLADVDYALNPYFGCAHGCLYCYAPDVVRCRNGINWGNWVDAKIDIPRKLKKEIGEIGNSVIGLSTVTDPYQPAEKRLELTRACLEIISDSDAALMLMTKSPLILRDVDIIKKIKRAEVCVTITTLDEEMGGLFENNVSDVKSRLSILETMSSLDIKTDAMVSPLLLSEENERLQLEHIIDAIRTTGCRSITFGKLRLRDIGRARLKKQYSGSKFENQIRKAVEKSENIDLNALIDSINKCRKYSDVALRVPNLF